MPRSLIQVLNVHAACQRRVAASGPPHAHQQVIHARTRPRNVWAPVPTCLRDPTAHRFDSCHAGKRAKARWFQPSDMEGACAHCNVEGLPPAASNEIMAFRRRLHAAIDASRRSGRRRLTQTTIPIFAISAMRPSRSSWPFFQSSRKACLAGLRYSPEAPTGWATRTPSAAIRIQKTGGVACCRPASG